MSKNNKPKKEKQVKLSKREEAKLKKSLEKQFKEPEPKKVEKLDVPEYTETEAVNPQHIVKTIEKWEKKLVETEAGIAYMKSALDGIDDVNEYNAWVGKIVNDIRFTKTCKGVIQSSYERLDRIKKNNG